MLSVIIPAHNEKQYLNKTIDNFLTTARGDIEVVVVLNGYDQEVDKRATVLRYKENLGERVAMNSAAHIARGDYLLRIDAHCNVEPEGWDLKVLEVFKDKPKAVAVLPLTALDKQWNRIPGHWYGFCKMIVGQKDGEKFFEEKWWRNNEDSYEPIEPNMSFTGCGFVISRAFYMELGGADESLSSMGAIGPEFALYGWMEGDGVYTRTDVLIGHIFDTGGYDTSGVVDARKGLYKKYGHRYQELVDRFGVDEQMTKPAVTTDNNHRTVTINRKDEHVTKDENGRVLKKLVEYYKYVYEDDGKGPSEDEIREMYADRAKKVGEELYYPDHEGNLVKV